jgi:peptidoglycan/xylan/chitin deacetylase (PgdA/CDA1 family)
VGGQPDVAGARGAGSVEAHVRTTVRAVAHISLPAARALRSARRRPVLTVLGWHRFGALHDGLSVPADVFRQQLAALECWGATVLDLETAWRRVIKGTLPPRAVVLTFDDAYASVLEVAWPLLRQRGWPATLFVVTEYTDGRRRFPWDARAAASDETRTCGLDEIVTAADAGLAIGSHTATHPWLPSVSGLRLRRELEDSRRFLEWELVRPVHTIAYPMGGWDSHVRAAAAAAGYRIGVTVDRGVNTVHRDPLVLRRSIAPDNLRDFELMLEGAYTWLRPVDTWRKGGLPS